MGRGEKSLLSDSGSELRLGRSKEKEKCEDNKRSEREKKKKTNPFQPASQSVFTLPRKYR